MRSRAEKTENGLEQISRCDLLWKPRTIRTLSVPSSFVAKIKERDIQQCSLSYDISRGCVLTLLGLITLIIPIIRDSQAFAVDPTVDVNEIGDKAWDVAFQQDFVSKHHLLLVNDNSV